MKRKRFTVEVPVMELCRQAGVAEQIFYPCKKQYVGLEIDRIRQLKTIAGRERPVEGSDNFS